ncbi:TetR/AcrR family transcriptional regulator [Ectopseudomonas mendocina]|uniref:TetR/AcrR family transcriptional regulator n=2 Tax=Ectopseudomonas mendocina TaxID=300 RepID=A0ABD7RUN4_ECTME|nr:TetR/AcrR family transcriptional regulator [Pseudomonas mendocina]ALN18792.1 TetR family transcriptional regulator [Pseudomonas mendocina S5.2]KES00356.1 TetR family transcriptional regulator [Pseudomonas mendocina]TRO11584.1 TetR/AcrR family transcriptional regulator [Pseudomonas mendocina]TRO16570.1 TetR/AcrR family transcriptional regulator [Pseudomonas mendocina]
MRYQDQLFQQRESALLEAARQLFQNHSWDRVTIAEVARQAGIGKGTVYKHFTSKEALYARLVLDCSRQHLAELQEIARSVPTQEAMRRVIRRAFELLQADPLQAQLCLLCDRPAFQERLEQPYREQFIELEGQYMYLFSGLLQSSFRDLQLSPTHCQHLLWGVEACVNGVMARIASGGFAHWAEYIELDAYFDRVTDFIIAGLQGQAAALLAAPAINE